MTKAISRNRWGCAGGSLFAKTLTALSLAALCGVASAATITVNTLADDVYVNNLGATFSDTALTTSVVSANCTLRMAMAAANLDVAVGGCTAGSGADVINITPTGTIRLNAQSMSVAPISPEPATASWLLFASREVTINGPASGELIISGELSESLGRRLLLASNGSTTTDEPISISNVTFYRGRSTAGAGGCFFSRESVTLTNVVFDGCESYGSATTTGLGGAFGVFETLLNGNLRPNVTLNNVTARSNRARRGLSTSRSEAGAAAIGSGSGQVGAVSISNSRIEGNSAERTGGLQIVNATSVSISNSAVLANSALGVPVLTSPATDPTADDGNGRYAGMLVSTVTDDVTITSSGFLGNTARGQRAGFAVTTVGGTTTLNDVSVIGNYSERRIGGFEISSDFLNTSGCVGTQKRAVNLTNVSVERNIAAHSLGGFRVFCSGDVSIANSQIVANEVEGTTAALSGGNSAGDLSLNTSVVMTNVTIADNRTYKGSVDGGFGVFRVSDVGTFTGTKLTVRDNYAQQNEAGITLQPVVAGRVYQISDSAFVRNRANSISALLLNRLGDFSVKNTTFSGNEITNANGGDVVTINTKVASGTANVLFENVTLARNAANATGLNAAAFANDPGAPSANVVLKNSIFGQYQFGSGFWPAFLPATAGVTYTVNNSLFEAGAFPAGFCGSNGNLCNLDAKLEGLAQNGGGIPTHALRGGSPALDSGTTTSTLTSDQRGVGFARVFGSAVDMGAFESQVALAGPTACKLDMNNDGQVLASREGLILLRSMLGFSSAAAVVGTSITQGEWETTRNNLNANCGTALQ